MSIHEAELEGPLCPGCGYSLQGLVGRVCPECSRQLGSDLSIYRSTTTGLVLDHWSARLWARASLGVLGAPFRRGYGARRSDIAMGPALVFAFLWSAVGVMVYPV